MLKKPFSGNYTITQKFGENLNSFYKAEGLKGHQGIDFNCPMGTPILSPCDGTVIFISTDIVKGEGVTVLSDQIFKFNGQDCHLSCVHWHLKDQSVVVKVGQKVKTGDLLGLSNNTGQTTGPHLHLSVAPLSLDGSMRLLAGIGNGYKGCIDPMPYLDLTPTPEMVEFTHIWKRSVNTVKAFQLSHGLVGDGKVGPLTQSVIDKLI